MKERFTSEGQFPCFACLLSRPPFWDKCIYLLFFPLLLSFAAGAQVAVQGTVKNVNGQGLPGVTVRLSGTSVGSTTDNAGKYTISLPADTGILVFSYIGFVPREVAIAGRKNIDVVLQDNATGLQGVV